MINIIKADIIRLFKSKSFYLSLGVFIFIYIICIFMQNATQSSEIFDASQKTSEPGFYIAVDGVVKSLNSFAIIFGHSFGVLILGIYLSSFVYNEYSSGYIKNIATLSHGRVASVISKIAAAIIIDVIIIILCYGIGFLLGNILIKNFEIESINVIFKSIIAMFCLSLALFSLIIFITILFKNKAAGIILLFFISSGMLLPFITALLEIINLSSLSQYSLSSLFLNTATIEGNELIKIILISFFYAIFYNTLSVGILQKRDI